MGRVDGGLTFGGRGAGKEKRNIGSEFFLHLPVVVHASGERECKTAIGQLILTHSLNDPITADQLR
jgi:hypothetical protein